MGGWGEGPGALGDTALSLSPGPPQLTLRLGDRKVWMAQRRRPKSASPHFLPQGTPQPRSSREPDLQSPGALPLSCTQVSRAQGLAITVVRSGLRAALPLLQVYVLAQQGLSSPEQTRIFAPASPSASRDVFPLAQQLKFLSFNSIMASPGGGLSPWSSGGHSPQPVPGPPHQLTHKPRGLEGPAEKATIGSHRTLCHEGHHQADHGWSETSYRCAQGLAKTVVL